MTPTRIRELISYAQHMRRDFERLTPARFIAHETIGQQLNSAINELKALQIPERYHAERMVREAEIGACEDTIRRWLKTRGQSYLLPPSPPVQVDFETYAEEGTAAHEHAARVYGRGRVVLRVIDGGKK